MLLEPLTNALVLVRDRIMDFETEFTTNEAQTRLSLVDPVLKALGWDPEDPSSVRVEFPVRQRNRNSKADYALLTLEQKPVAFVEAKRLGTDLGLAQDQLFEYGTGESVPYAVATNGANWAVYKRERQGADLLFKQLLAVSITNQPPTLAAIKLLSLWKGLLSSHSSIDQIAPALDALEAEPPRQINPVVPPSVPAPPKEVPNAATLGVRPHHSAPPGDRSTSSESESFDLGNPPNVSHKKPTGLLLPDGTKKQISKWSSVLGETAKWLLANNILTVDLPWKANPNSSRNTLQQSEIYNKHGAKIKAQIQIDTNLFLLTNYDARSICNVTAKLLTDCGLQNSMVAVTLAHHDG